MLDLGRRKRGTHQLVGLLLGPSLCFVMFLLDGQQQVMSGVAWRTAAVSLWMAVWWATEAVPVAVTALLPLISF
ncbi:MAG: hypothetical protein OSA42_07970, partial [Porticoccaceae bacterium]|nr:hypothetical protein [Porticoccaceae bacterium]